MIVYGERVRRIDPRAALDQVARGLASEAATRALLEASEIAQGWLDAEHARRGADGLGAIETTLGAWLVDLARAAFRPDDAAAIDRARRGLARLREAAPPERIETRTLEGFAFYAVLPEPYALAARELRAEVSGPIVVVGVRSIGLCLGAVVAACADAVEPLLSVRPVGHPHARELATSAALDRHVASLANEATFAVVDEGPGLSGTSFGCVAAWLERCGVPSARIRFFPSHEGDPGARSTAGARERWRTTRRHVVPFERAFAPRRVATMLGFDAAAKVEELGAGRWRRLVFSREEDWPPVDAQTERRKYLVEARGRRFLAKFVGLGRVGEAASARGRALAKAGFAAEPCDLRHGFLVAPWVAAKPATVRTDVDRSAFAERVGHYLAFVATELGGAGPEDGASLEALLAMAKHNAREALGDDIARELDRWDGRLPAMAGALRRVRTDNRMHAWEWLVCDDGRLLKADALDHHAAHDLIGAQDLAWDVAAGSVELAWTPAERELVLETIARRGGPRIVKLALRFFGDCYLAFQLGAHRMAAERAHDAERRRLEAAASRYEKRLAELLSTV